MAREHKHVRSQRLLSCLLLLQGKRRMTARELSTRLDVSTRTVYRDVEALCEAGVPIHMERGSLGGVVLADDYRRALAQFTDDDLRALFASGPGPLGDIGIAPQTQALQKLAGALPAMQRRAAETARARLFVDQNRWSRGEQPTDVLVRLRRASELDRRVRLRYRDRDGASTERTVDPLGLVAKAGVWYAIAREEAKGYRTFRAQRIVSVEELPESFARPDDFDLEAHWNASVSSIERQTQETYDVVLRVPHGAISRFSAFFNASTLEENEDSSIVRVSFPSRDVAIVHVMVTGRASADVLAPADFTAAIVACARDAIAAYGSSENSIEMPASAKEK